MSASRFEPWFDFIYESKYSISTILANPILIATGPENQKEKYRGKEEEEQRWGDGKEREEKKKKGRREREKEKTNRNFIIYK